MGRNQERQIMKSGKNTKRRSRTDWKRIDAMRDEDIDFSDIPEQGADFFAYAIIWPGPKKQITLRLDPDVLTFFRKHGRGYQSTINAVLRKYMEARKERTSDVRPRNSANQHVSGRGANLRSKVRRRVPSCRTSAARASKYCREFRTECCLPAPRAPKRPHSNPRPRPAG